MADGLLYQDSREPILIADASSVTLAATAKALVPAGSYPVLGGNYFSRIGKKVRIEMFGRITTAATPGNGSFDVYWGTGADANGSIICSSAAVALTASQTNVSWYCTVDITCRSTGATGTLFGTGYAIFNEAVLAARMMIPASAPAVSGSLDLTAALIPNIQFKRSGSTAETMQVHQMQFTALN